MRKRPLLILLLVIGLRALGPMTMFAQTDLRTSITSYFKNYQAKGYRPSTPLGVDSFRVDDERYELAVYANEPFYAQTFSPELVKRVYRELSQALPAPYNTYHLTVYGRNGMTIEELIPNILRPAAQDAARLWGFRDYKGNPWVTNTSRPFSITDGLQNRHLFIWPSHGKYYKSGSWNWQRPFMFCTAEDIFTQSFVSPFLIPMLERAGAVVGMPRERDSQTHEAIVDNDKPERQGTYSETSQDDAVWISSADSTGFSPALQLLTDEAAPFRSGTYRYAPATDRKSRLATACWMPDIPETGCYAVYVSYSTRPNSVPDAHYTVFHRGGRTNFVVNQQMGGGTWVYLGTFEFEKGCSLQGRVVLTNQSTRRGTVTADAVRFGGGVGQTERGTAGTSGVPRFLEGARYYAQWAGLPDSLYKTEAGDNDYSDDLRTRGNMLNFMSGGSVYNPRPCGLRIPYELSLALHSDAGYKTDDSVYGSLSICTTVDAEGNTSYPSGLSRKASTDFSALLLNNLVTDLSATFNTEWTRRENWDRNYAETRMPNVPSAILEMLSHQNFGDMKYGHDPIFKFTLARSVYKSVLRFVHFGHGRKSAIVQPLPVSHFSALLSEDGKEVRLTWKPREDTLEPTAAPTGYIVYTKVDEEGFDNGRTAGNSCELRLPISPDRIYSFKVTAINNGGESFPSETLSVFHSSKESRRVLIVNAFTRLSGPAWVCTPDSLGFDLSRDMGVPYICTTAFSGRQRNFNRQDIGREGTTGLGYSGQELVGRTLAGNTFDYPLCHGRAIASAGYYSFSSMSAEVFGQNETKTKPYAVIDYIAGQQADLPYNLRKFKVFTSAAREKLAHFLHDEGGALLLSGSYIGSDNRSEPDARHFNEHTLKVKYDGNAQDLPSGNIAGLGTNFSIYRVPCAEHYAAQSSDAILPASAPAFSVLTYENGQGAGVAYPGKDYRSFAMAFPFECITDSSMRDAVMQAILKFLTIR